MMEQNIAVSTDCSIFCRSNKRISILLIKRASTPFKGKWALPGGFIEEKEELAVGAKRELLEETGLVVEDLIQLKAFGAIGRDPRGRTISIAFMGEVADEKMVDGADDAAAAEWVDIHQLPALAFDHQEIVELAFSRFCMEKGIDLHETNLKKTK